MVTTVQNKNNTTITIARRLSKNELERLVTYINRSAVKPQKHIKKAQAKQIGYEITQGIWNRFVKEHGLS